jgi:hypothetical protein
MKLLSMKFSQLFSYFLSFRSKYSTQKLIFKVLISAIHLRLQTNFHTHRTGNIILLYTSISMLLDIRGIINRSLRECSKHSLTSIWSQTVSYTFMWQHILKFHVLGDSYLKWKTTTWKPCEIRISDCEAVVLQQFKLSLWRPSTRRGCSTMRYRNSTRTPCRRVIVWRS